MAAIFAIHPLHVSSVAWVAERRELLAGFFFMLLLLAYARYAERPSLARYLAAFACLAAGLMSKPTLVTAPFVLLLLDYWPLGRIRPRSALVEPGRLGRWPTTWQLVAEKIPLLALVAAACLITLWTHRYNRVVGDVPDLSLSIRIANALISCGAYVVQSFFPVGLSPQYPHLGPDTPYGPAAAGLMLLVVVTALAVVFRRRLPAVLVGWLWFLGMLAPVLGLVGSFTQSRADNYTYLSQIGLSIAVAWGVAVAYRSRPALRSLRWPRYLLGAAAGVSLVALGAVAWRQTTYWRTPEALWTRVVACTAPNAMGDLCLACAYLNEGRVDEAIPLLNESLATYSISRYVTGEAHGRLAYCLNLLGKPDEAMMHLQEGAAHLPGESTTSRRVGTGARASRPVRRGTCPMAGGGRPLPRVVDWPRRPGRRFAADRRDR